MPEWMVSSLMPVVVAAVVGNDSIELQIEATSYYPVFRPLVAARSILVGSIVGNQCNE